MGKVTHRRRTPRSQGGGCSAQPVGLRRRRRGPGQVPHESSARWRGLRTQCPPPSELAAAQETALPPTAVIIFVHSIRCVSVGYVGVISPSASHWLLQVLEIANGRRVVAPDQTTVCGDKPPDGKLLTVTMRCPRGGYSVFLLLQASAEPHSLIAPSLPRAGPAEEARTAVFFRIPGGSMCCCPS